MCAMMMIWVDVAVESSFFLVGSVFVYRIKESTRTGERVIKDGVWAKKIYEKGERRGWETKKSGVN